MLTASTITDAQIRELRETTRAVTHEHETIVLCDIALGDTLFNDIGRVQAIRSARARCAEILNDCAAQGAR